MQVPQDHARLIAQLQSLYGDVLFTRRGETYPALLLPPAPEQETDVDSVLARTPPQNFVDPDTFVIYQREHLEARQRAGRTLTNGACYIFRELTRNPLQLSADLGRYFDMMATCDALNHELRDYVAGARQDLPLRERLHQNIPSSQIMTTGRGRSAIIGVANLTVFNWDGRYHAIMAQRSAKLAVGAGLLHVIPAFVMEPNHGDWSIHNQVLREYGEELFAMPEYDEWGSPSSTDYFHDFAPVAELRAMLADGRAELRLTGISFNLLSTRPEVCTLLLIHDDAWFTRSQAALDEALLTERQNTHYIPIDTLEGLPEQLAPRFVPQGGVTFWAGLEKARHLVGLS